MEFCRNFEARAGGDAKVRVRTDIVIAARDGKLPMEHFNVLWGVYSIIGRQPYKWVSVRLLGSRALGYKSAKADRIVEREFQPVGEDQLRGSIQFLHGAGFFAFTTNGDRMFFSIRMRQHELELAVNPLGAEHGSQPGASVAAACSGARGLRCKYPSAEEAGSATAGRPDAGRRGSGTAMADRSRTDHGIVPVQTGSFGAGLAGFRPVAIAS